MKENEVVMFLYLDAYKFFGRLPTSIKTFSKNFIALETSFNIFISVYVIKGYKTDPCEMDIYKKLS